MGSSRSFSTQDFTGIVEFKAYSIMPNGKNSIGAAGKVSIFQDKDVVGFETKGNEANWIARVDGPTGSVNILGCQIRMIHQFDNGLPAQLDSTFYLVP